MVDWSPDAPLRSNKWKSHGNRKPSKKKKVKKNFRIHKKTAKIPDAGNDGGKPVIDEIVGGRDVEPPRKYKVSHNISTPSLERFLLCDTNVPLAAARTTCLFPHSSSLPLRADVVAP